MTAGYWDAPEMTERLVSEDHWLHTGDVGRFDEDGFLTICGRSRPPGRVTRGRAALSLACDTVRSSARS